MKTYLLSVARFYEEALGKCLSEESSYHFFNVLCEEYVSPLTSNVFSDFDGCLPITYTQSEIPKLLDLNLRKGLATDYISKFSLGEQKTANYSALEELIRNNLFLSFEIVEGMAGYDNLFNINAPKQFEIWFNDFKRRWTELLWKILAEFSDDRLYEIHYCKAKGISAKEAEKGIMNRLSYTVWLYAFPSTILSSQPANEYFPDIIHPRRLSKSELDGLLQRKNK